MIPNAPIRLCAPSGKLGDGTWEVPVSLFILETGSFCLCVCIGCMYARVNFPSWSVSKMHPRMLPSSGIYNTAH